MVIGNSFKSKRMQPIGAKLFPEAQKKRLSFNQTQAVHLLIREGDMQKFNAYASSCKMTSSEIEECLNEVTVGDLNFGS